MDCKRLESGIWFKGMVTHGETTEDVGDTRSKMQINDARILQNYMYITDACLVHHDSSRIMHFERDGHLT